MKSSFNIVRRCIALLLVLVIGISVVACGSDNTDDKNSNNLGLETEKEVTIWYTDSKYMDYIKVVADGLHASNEKLTVNIQYIEDKDYLTKIYNDSIREGNGPDVFIAESSELEKMCSMGIVAENNVYASNYTSSNYCESAIKAATYNDKLYGYPIDFNVAFMAYNTTHAYYISTFAQLDEYIAHFDSTEDNEAIKQIVSWDVSDMFLNFGFSSGSVEIGGPTGDDSTAVSVNDAQLVKVMKEFLRFRDGYGITKSAAAKIENNELFKNGNMSYTIMDMQYFKSLIDSQVAFDVCEIPALSDELKPTTLSETTLALVSPYADDLEIAKAVANALSFDYASKLTETTGGISARKMAYEGDYAKEYEKIYEIYSNSVIKAQFRGAASMYAYYEIMINQVYGNNDAGVDVEADTEADADTIVNNAVAEFAGKLKPREVQTESQSQNQ